MGFLLEQHDAIAAIGEQGRRRGSRRSAADHDDVAFLRGTSASKIFVHANTSLKVAEAL